ncbi:TMV resistance protein N-like [Eucalyptus grandis]|uniref:TMV resistance protein N-like n=1 Tax=Eucalyptus grandis TaxID=71139 RepID=UPI00192F0A08|nr:TMV resistance protein N-like [Eucalyptus grandis]
MPHIFSEDNAYSRLCWEEVVKIMECKKQRDLKIFPVVKIMECKKQRDLKIFPVLYRVELGRVSGLKGSYLTGIEYFRKKLNKDVRKLMRWKDALQEAGSLSGWYLDNETSEAKIIEDIVKKISELKMYDVFLSFRGKDVRDYFVKGLNEALVQKGIKTFMDSKNLRMGQDFPSKLKEAIEQSRMYVIVFSENYSKSWWCLK